MTFLFYFINLKFSKVSSVILIIFLKSKIAVDFLFLVDYA